jgi:limonene-1,2-epoxide hydrolase
MDIPVACIFEFDGDRLLCEKVYFDMATLVNQLRATTISQTDS